MRMESTNSKINMAFSGVGYIMIYLLPPNGRISGVFIRLRCITWPDSPLAYARRFCSIGTVLGVGFEVCTLECSGWQFPSSICLFFLFPFHFSWILWLFSVCLSAVAFLTNLWIGSDKSWLSRTQGSVVHLLPFICFPSSMYVCFSVIHLSSEWWACHCVVSEMCHQSYLNISTSVY